MSRPTIREVAAAAGVSVASVSRALSDQPGVSPSMSRRVHSAAAELGYQANFIARSLRMSETGTLGMLVPSFSNIYFATIIEAVEKQLAPTGGALIVSDSLDDLDIERERLQLLEGRMVDGLVVIPLDFEGSAKALQPVVSRTPTVLVDRRANVTGVDYVGLDNQGAMKEIIAHLRSLGAEDIIYVGVQAGANTASERDAAFRECLGLPPGKGDIGGRIYSGDFSIGWGVRAAKEILALPKLPDAIVCAADIIAVPLMGEFRDAGVQIPEQVMVASYDDSVLAKSTVPRLTSVAHPLDQVASAALTLLENRMRNLDAPTLRVTVEPHLMVRDSTIRSSGGLPA